MDVHTYQRFDAVGLSELIQKKEVKPDELLHASFKRLEEVNPRLNAVVRTREEKVYQEATLAQNEGQPFFGVPMLLKDISQALKDEPLTAGSSLLKGNIQKQDAHFTKRLKQAGFLMMGQTNTPEFGLKNITEPDLYGPTKNPWNPHYSPGGSSGGAAAAVASGIVPVAGASDGGGSIRIPASFTGLFGLKPTRGRTPVGPGVGRQWQGAAIDFVLSRSVRDSAHLLDVLQTVQPEAAFQTPLYSGRYADIVKGESKQTYRIAFTTASPVRTAVSDDAKQSVHKVVKWLEKQGHIVEEKEVPLNGIEVMKDYYTMNCGEMNRVVRQMEGALSRPISSDDLDIFTWVLHETGKHVTASEYSESLAGWDKASEVMAQFHETYDFYITPTNAYSAPAIGELTPNKMEMKSLRHVDHLSIKDQRQLVYDMFLPSLTYTPFTQLANLTGQPAMNVPTSLTEEGMPMGVQFIASKGREDQLLDIASQLETSHLWQQIIHP
ncbi:amidase [Pelagirhabdus alkalitolerans]|uniref:Amidase n=1 Tax=Pelagirhabdus alkalitolerans TaxID=1612202 RepID=A0A1G6IY22_9BACI|nr:amidase [Pelagirhabdus alkalitolerans]SDC11452.1 amidase [Pelagirhabdus alkalitolerans]